jgi:hypothetical protein
VKDRQVHFVITETQLNGLLAGLNFEIMGYFDELNYDKIFKKNSAIYDTFVMMRT